MGIHIIQSHSLERLFKTYLATQIDLQQSNAGSLETLLQKEHIITPNASVQAWLDQQIAQATGICANIEWHSSVNEFQWFAFKELSSDKEAVRQANLPRLVMKWQIYQYLLDFVDTDDNRLEQEKSPSPQQSLLPLVQRVYQYAERFDDEVTRKQQRQKMTYWLANQISKVFAHYLIYRQDWLQKWSNAQSIQIEQLAQYHHDNQRISDIELDKALQIEAWQQHLWWVLFRENFASMQSIQQQFWQNLQLSKTALPFVEHHLPKTLAVFTILDLAPVQLQFLQQLGEFIDIYIYHFSPTQEYWADSVDPRWKQLQDLKIKERITEQRPDISEQALQAYFESLHSGFNPSIREARHPLLTRFGKQARDHFSLLSQLSGGNDGQWFDVFADEDGKIDFPNHLLGKVQHDIFYLLEPESHQLTLQDNDDSIQLHICHSSLRQVEVLKEQLVYWLSQGTAENPRQLQDILVLSPNLPDIEPHIRSIFASGDMQLAVNLAGSIALPIQKAWQFFIKRMTWVNSRFYSEEFADWLNLPASRAYYALDDYTIQRMMFLLKEAGFKRGFDAQHLQKTLLPEDDDFRFSFKYALDRLAMAVAVPDVQLCQTANEEILSSDLVNEDDFKLIGTLLQIYADLNERRDWLDYTASSEQSSKYTVEQWLQCLLTELDILQNAGVEHLQNIREMIKKYDTMLSLAYNLQHTHQQSSSLKQLYLPLSAILQEIQQQLDHQMEKAEPSGAITFSQIGHIRPLPYKLIVLLNMDTGVFPSQERPSGFDLISLLPNKLGDRSRLEDHQGAFLDALLLAKEQLWVFYNGFDIESNEVLEPSSAVIELVQHLQQLVEPAEQDSVVINHFPVSGALQSLYYVHSPQPFIVQSFVQNKIKRFKDQWFKVAEQLNAQLAERGELQTLATADKVLTYAQQQQDDYILLDADKWAKQMEMPAKLLLDSLKIANPMGESAAQTLEPLIPDYLEQYQLIDMMLQSVQEQDVELDDLKTRALDKLPAGKIKHSVWQQKQGELSEFQQYLAELKLSITETTQRLWTCYFPDEQHQIAIQMIVPKQLQQQLWCSIYASDIHKGKYRLRHWLQYLCWLSYLNLGDQGQQYQLLWLGKKQSVLCAKGLSSNQAQYYLKQWLGAWQYAQYQPMMFSANMILSHEKFQENEQFWSETESHLLSDDTIDRILKEWNSVYVGVISNIDNDSRKTHLHWQYILQQLFPELDADIAVRQSLQQFSHLYYPLTQYQSNFFGSEE